MNLLTPKTFRRVSKVMQTWFLFSQLLTNPFWGAPTSAPVASVEASVHLLLHSVETLWVITLHRSDLTVMVIALEKLHSAPQILWDSMQMVLALICSSSNNQGWKEQRCYPQQMWAFLSSNYYYHVIRNRSRIGYLVGIGLCLAHWRKHYPSIISYRSNHSSAESYSWR